MGAGTGDGPSGPPDALIRSLVDGPSLVSGVEWHGEVGSTNAVAAAAAARGAAEGHLVLADVQTAGRGRQGRLWHAPADSSLMLSLLLRPNVDRACLPLLPLLTGLVLAEAVAPHVPAAPVALKWPNDLLVGGRKSAGILVEGLADGAAVVGVGLNVDWRGVERPPALAGATSLAEAAGHGVDRWRVLAGLVGLLSRWYRSWVDAPADFLDSYRARCATIGQTVRVSLDGRGALTGASTGVDRRGALLLRVADGTVVAVSAGDVEHVRPA